MTVFRISRNLLLIVVGLFVGIILHLILVMFGTTAFLKLVTEWKLPDYQLTADFLGHEVRPATAYSAVYIADQGYDDDAPSRLKKFLLQYNDVGLPPMRLIFFTRSEDHDYWSVDLPGCDPGRCLDNFDGGLAVPTDQSEYDEFLADGSNVGAGIYPIYASRILGMQIGSSAYVATNKRGEIVYYELTARRAATLNPIDRFLVSTVSVSADLKHFPSIYSKNLVLNTVQQE